MYSVQCCPQQTVNFVCVLCATCVFYLIKSVLQDLPNSPCRNRLNLTIMRNKLILIQDSFHNIMFRLFTLLHLNLNIHYRNNVREEHVIQIYILKLQVFVSVIRSNSSHTVVFCRYISCNVPSADMILSLIVSTLFAQYKFVSIEFYHYKNTQKIDPLMLSLLFKCHYT